MFFTNIFLSLLYLLLGIVAGGKGKGDGISTSSFNNHEYSFHHDGTKTTEKAQEECDDDGGYLANINSLQEGQFIIDFMQDYFPDLQVMWLALYHDIGECLEI